MPLDIRPATPADLEALTEIYNHYVRESPATFDIEPFKPEERREWLAGFAEHGPYRLLVAAEGTDVQGYAYSHRFRPRRAYETSIETSIYLRHGETGRGLGSRLYAALFRALEGEDLHRAYAGITLPNEASVALHASFDFRLIGTYREVGRKFGRYWDVAWYEKPL